MQDYNEDGKLSFSEFSDLIDAFGNEVAANKVWVEYLPKTRKRFDLIVSVIR